MDIFKAIWGLGFAGIAILIILFIESLFIITSLIKFLVRRLRSRDQSNNTLLYYDPKQGIFYYPKDAWQKKFGYSKLYDENAITLGMVLDCEPVKFIWNRRRWLIELWKGQYDIAAGAEIGVYSREVTDGNTDFFPDTDEFLDMKMTLATASETIFNIQDNTWWLTGFVAGMFAWPDELVLTASIRFRRESMAEAFLNELYRMGYSQDEADINGDEVSIIYTHPKSPQPRSRTYLLQEITQAKNRLIAWYYRRVIKSTGKTEAELLNELERKKPRLFRRLIGGARTQSGYISRKGGR